VSAARRTAEETLLDRALVLVGPAKFEKFLALLESPPKPGARLRRTMKTASPWRERRPAAMLRPPELLTAEHDLGGFNWRRAAGAAQSSAATARECATLPATKASW
jgi:Protein of unknown function (DUF1778)